MNYTFNSTAKRYYFGVFSLSSKPTKCCNAIHHSKSLGQLQSRRGMKEKITFLVKNVFNRTIQKLGELEKQVTFNFNIVEVLNTTLSSFERAKFLSENQNNTLVDLEFDDSLEAQAVKNLPENDFQGRIFESVSSGHRGHLAIKSKLGNPLMEYKVHCRSEFFKFENLLGKQYKGTYGVEKIDGIDAEHEKFVLDAYAENFLSKVKIFEIKTSRVGDIESSINSALRDINFNGSREHIIAYLQKNYQMSNIKDCTEIEKILSY